MISILLPIGICVVVSIGLAVFSDWASPEFHHRITSWPFPTMPATNGAICCLLFIGGMAMLLYWVGVIGSKLGGLG